MCEEWSRVSGRLQSPGPSRTPSPYTVKEAKAQTELAFPQVTQQEAARKAESKPPRVSTGRDPCSPTQRGNSLCTIMGRGAVSPGDPQDRYSVPPQALHSTAGQTDTTCLHFEHNQSQYNLRGPRPHPLLSSLNSTLGCPCLRTGVQNCHNLPDQGWPVGVNAHD